MDALTSRGEGIVFIDDEVEPVRPPAGRWRISLWIGAASAMVLVALATAVPAASSIRSHRRAQCVDRLKQLAAALHGYHEQHGHFPAPSYAGRDGKPLLSWRVAILPYLGYGSLYDRFHLEESWDSPHNLGLLKEMPLEFACPAGPGRRTARTGYLVVVGPVTDYGSVNTPFEPTRGVDIREITDGTSNTILVFESDATVPWTKPDDLHWARGGPSPRMSSPHAGGANMLFADGTVRFIKVTIDGSILRGIFTINGGEVLSEA